VAGWILRCLPGPVVLSTRTGELAGGGYRFALFSPSHDRARQCDGEWRSSPYSKMIRAIFYFRKTTQQFCRRLAARTIHAHIQRRFVPETESARGRIQLPRRNAQVGENNACLFDFRFREDPRKFHENQQCTVRKREPYSANRSLANSSASLSRSIASTCASELACRIASLCPPSYRCNRQTIRRALPPATRSSLEVARDDGAPSPCPPKAPPSPPPRDLVSKSFL